VNHNPQTISELKPANIKYRGMRSSTVIDDFEQTSQGWLQRREAYFGKKPYVMKITETVYQL